MDLKTLFLIQAVIISFFLVSIYILVLRIEAVEEIKFKESLNKYNYLDEKDEKDIGVIKNQYIVVLRENATFIDGNK